MKLFNFIAVFAMVSWTFVSAGKTQTSIKPTTFLRKSECLIVTPGFNARCNYVMITSGSKTTNIHFSRDKAGSQSISFVIVNKTFNASQEEIKTASLFIRNPNSIQINKSGACMVGSSTVRCVTSDGKYSAFAAN